MSAILSKILPKTDILSFDELGIYKIIMGLKTPDVIEQLYEKYLEPLINYDNTTGSDYVEFISAYIENDGHIKNISEKMYIHRNTVHYKIRKIDDILCCDISKLEVKAYLMFALMYYKLKRQAAV